MFLRQFSLLLLLPASITLAADAPTGPIPRGTVTKHTFNVSKIFPGTVREYWVYVPAQYDGSKPACLWVNQDGIQNNAPAVFDRLIAAKEMPVTIGVFVTPGKVPAPNKNALDRFNRSFEYDSLGDRYARFLLEELLPHIAKEQNLKISSDGNDRAIGGSSSGAVCAFTVAWERPDAFRRVFSTIGTYVGLRGANVYPTLIRKTEPKPLRVYLQDGSSDLNIYGGDWWMANQEMERALTFAGYEVNHYWGVEGHNGKDAAKIFPAAMRWLWKDWPKPIHVGAGSSQLQEIVVPGEGWKVAAEEQANVYGLSVSNDGALEFTEPPKGKVTIGSDGKRLTRRVKIDVASGGYYLQHHLNFYITTRKGGDSEQQNVLLSPDGNEFGKPIVVASGLHGAAGLALSPDQTLLYVAEGRSHWVTSYQIQPDGTLADGQRFYHLHAPDDADDAGAGGMCVDRGGRLYVATRMGVQVCDQPGRVNCILPVGAGPISEVCFGGDDSKTLFAVSGGKIYKRKMKVGGVKSTDQPIKPPTPHL